MTYHSEVIADSPTALLRFGEASGTTAVDEIAARNGVYNGGVTLGVTGALPGDSDKAVTLDGSTGYVSIADQAALQPGNGAWSFELWFKCRVTPTAVAVQTIHMSGNVGSASPRLSLSNSVAGRLIATSDGWGQGCHSSVNIADTNWHHVVYSKTSGHVWSIILDGVDVTVADTSAQTGTGAIGPTNIGRKTDGTTYFDGSVDEYAPYIGTVLSVTRAAAHWAARGSTSAVSASAGVATATGAASVASSAALRSDAGVSSATGSALGPTIGSSPRTFANAGVASATGSAKAPTTSQVAGTRVGAGIATASGTAWAPRAQTSAETGLVFDVYSAANPNGSPLATLVDAVGKGVTFSLRGIGAGAFAIPRNSAQATPAVIAQGNLVKVRLPEVSATPLGAFWLETGRFDLISDQESGRELLTFGGSGALSYVGRAILWSQSFVAGEPNPADNEWRLYEGTFGPQAGQILNRLMLESTSPTRPQQPLPSLSWDFTYSQDSAGNVWATTPGTSALTAHVGDYLDDVIGQILTSTDSLVVQMDANLKMRAYNALGIDRSSATFASGKVRLQKGVNAVSGLVRELAADRRKSHILTAGDPGVFGSASSSNTPVREGFAQSAGTDVTGLNSLAASQLAIRTRSAESIKAQLPYGNDQANGLYRPGPAALGGHYWLGDTITVHTGTGTQDFNESPQVIAEITLSENEGGQVMSEVSLGSDYSSSDFSRINDAIEQNRTDMSNATNAAIRLAHTITRPHVVSSLPLLPDASFPQGALVLLDSDGKLYRNKDGLTWTAEVSAVDLTGQIDETQIADNAISTPMIQAGAVVAESIATDAVTAEAIAADAITAGAIAAGAVTAEALAAEIILVEKLLSTGLIGRRIELDEFGLRAYSGTEQLLVNIPTVGTDPVSVVGAVEASSLISTAMAELRGATVVPGNATVDLQVGVTNPISQPTLDGSTIPFTSLATAPTRPGHGLAYDPVGGDPGGGGGTPTFWVGADPTAGNLLDLAYEYDVTSGALLRILRKTGTTTTATGTIGSTSHVADTAEASSGSANSQIATPLTMPRTGTIRYVSVYAAGYGGSADVRNAVWNTAGQILTESAQYTMPSAGFSNGSSSHYIKAVTRRTLAAGVQFWAGFVRVSSADGFQWDRDDGSGRTTKKGQGLDGDMTGVTTDTTHRPNIYVTYEYDVDNSIEGAVAKIVGVARQTGADAVWLLDANGILYKYLQSTLAFVAKYDLSVRITGNKANAGLFFDGTNLVITTTTGLTAGRGVRFVRVATNGVYSSTLDAGGGPALNGASATVRGGYRDATNYWVAIVDAAFVGVAAFDAGFGTYVPNREFGLAPEIGSGIAFDGSRFRGWSAAAPTKINVFSTWDWTTESPLYWVNFAWYDSVGTPHESAPGPARSITMGRRRQLTVSTPPLPGGAAEPPDQVRVYAARGATDPGGTNYHLQATDAAVVRTITTFAAAGAANQATNGFPAGTAAVVRSGAGTAHDPLRAAWSLAGDGLKAGFLRYVPVTVEVLLGGAAPGAGVQTVTPTTIPTDGSVYAVAAMIGVRESTGAAVSLTLLNFDGTSAGWTSTSGVAGRGGFANVMMAVTGGTNNVQLKYTSTATTNVTIWIEIVGYWTYA